MTERCGHICCQIRANPYHRHHDTPETCPRCAAIDRAETEAATGVTLGRLVGSVFAHIAPEIPGLPEGDALAEAVASACLRVYGESHHDPAIAALSPAEHRHVLAGRVGLLLAFPDL